MNPVNAMVLTGYGLNCDYETDYSLSLAGAVSRRVHINEVIMGKTSDKGIRLDDYHMLVFGGGFSWADDHGAGVLFASKIRSNMEEQIERFVRDGKLIIGICNGFQAIVNMGLLPGFDGNYQDRRLAVTYNDCGNYVDAWVNLKVNLFSPCVFTKGLTHIELPVRHGEGKFISSEADMERLFEAGQVVVQYADQDAKEAQGRWPENPNGSMRDVAGICDPTGRIFGLMPHPEAFNHCTNHPDWIRRREALRRQGRDMHDEEGEGIRIFRNAVDYVRSTLL